MDSRTHVASLTLVQQGFADAQAEVLLTQVIGEASRVPSINRRRP